MATLKECDVRFDVRSVIPNMVMSLKFDLLLSPAASCCWGCPDWFEISVVCRMINLRKLQKLLVYNKSSSFLFFLCPRIFHWIFIFCFKWSECWKGIQKKNIQILARPKRTLWLSIQSKPCLCPVCPCCLIFSAFFWKLKTKGTCRVCMPLDFRGAVCSRWYLRCCSRRPAGCKNFTHFLDFMSWTVLPAAHEGRLDRCWMLRSRTL